MPIYMTLSLLLCGQNMEMCQFGNASYSSECYIMVVHQHSWTAFVVVFQLSAVGHVVVASGTDVAVNLSRILLLVGGTAGSLTVLHHPCLALILKRHFIGLFQHCGRSAYCVLTLNKFPHSSPEASRIIQMHETSTSKGGNYYQWILLAEP